MKAENLIVWTVLIVAHFVRMFPPLALSERKWARFVKGALDCVIGGAAGYGFGGALADALIG